MWVGFYSFLRVGRKKQNKFGSAELHFVPVPSNLHCPVKKLNLFFRYYLSLLYLSGRLSFYTCCQRFAAWRSGGFLAQKFNRRTALEPTTNLSYEALNPPLRQTAVRCWRSCPMSLLLVI